jgi:N-acetylmuramoyl-L-alanine amidase
MSVRSTCTLAALFAVACIACAQSPPRATIVVDPAHGGTDTGGRFSNDVLEKNVNFSLASKLRAALAAQDFNVVLTREAEPADPASAPPIPSPDQRAEIANHAHPIACLILHATSAGHGVHLFTSSLVPLTIVDEVKPVLRWETAQAASIPQSLRLINELDSSFHSAHVPLVIGRASIPPIDSLACPAVAVEIAPLTNDSGGTTPVTDSTYQQSVADAIANALISWRMHVEPTASSGSTTGAGR